MKYRNIDHLLLNANKGTSPVFFSPGDSVMVSLVDRGLLSVLIHQIDNGQMMCAGSAGRRVADKAKDDVIGKDEPVMFSFQKIAGINRTNGFS